MNVSSILNRLHAKARANTWLWLFYVFNRFSLALGFFVAGMVKIMDERFASGLHNKHPMGHYLEVLHQTGSYYHFIGVAQVLAAIFLIIPRTVTLGAFIYFPIILNIWVLTEATRFDGSMFTAPLMTFANLFLLGWNYEKWKFILPFNDITEQKGFETDVPVQKFTPDEISFFPNPFRYFYTILRNLLEQLFTPKFPFLKNFPWFFFMGVFAVMVFFVAIFPRHFNILPRNTYEKCMRQYDGGRGKTKAREIFCSCIHNDGEPINQCLIKYENAQEK